MTSKADLARRLSNLKCTTLFRIHFASVFQQDKDKVSPTVFFLAPFHRKCLLEHLAVEIKPSFTDWWHPL